tara:strand:- start:992 stop:1216 length:225 start_codon:yes stop_codon:yes gene_type:complete
MPSADKYEQQEIQDTNIFIAHGKEDNVIKFDSYIKTLEFLKRKTDKVEEFEGDFGHTITKDVTTQMTNWLMKIL